MSETDETMPADGSRCNDALHELYTFIDGELTTERRAAIEEHLEACPHCFEAFDFEAEIKGYLAEKCRERVPDSLKERIAQAITDTATAETGHVAPIAE